MNYYPFHVGDYAAHTAHLEPMEDLAYRRMLDLYYLREGALPADVADVARLIRMRSNLAEIEAVLSEFFVLTPDGWRHARCDAELERMQDKQTKARDAAKASVRARQAASAQRTFNGRSTGAQRTLSARSTDVELPTPTPTPTPVEAKAKTGASAPTPSELFPEVDPNHLRDWLAARKAKRLPLTATAAKGFRREAEKAGLSVAEAVKLCAEKGWAGLNSDWHSARASPPGKPPIAQQFAEKRHIGTADDEWPEHLRPTGTA